MSAPGHLSVRAELASATRDRILGALAEMLRRGDDTTFERLAKQSGVPSRTLYRHFANREVLFSAFWRWANDAIDAPPSPTTPEEVIGHIQPLYLAFDRDESLVRALMHDPFGRAVRAANARARRQKFSKALRSVTATLPEAEARSLLASVTVLCSANGWESMRDNWRLSGEVAAEAAQWAVTALINSARAMAVHDRRKYALNKEAD
jgi:AcrR family transcriptional regulator